MLQKNETQQKNEKKKASDYFPRHRGSQACINKHSRSYSVSVKNDD